MTKYWT